MSGGSGVRVQRGSSLRKASNGTKATLKIPDFIFIRKAGGLLRVGRRAYCETGGGGF